MNQPAKDLAVQAAAELPATHVTSIMLNGDLMNTINQMATMMANGNCTIPDHLQGNHADCYAIALQACQWMMNPFQVAQKTHLVNGTIGYEAQLVNAVTSPARGASRAGSLPTPGSRRKPPSTPPT